jgi:protein-S-isoprenylcysteine O-methyltransferase Ste14
MKLPRPYPPLWFLLFALVALGLVEVGPGRLALGPGIDYIALVLAALGGLLALWARWMFLQAGTSVHPHQETSRLLTHGVYRISRNPMYLGLLLALVGWVIWLQNLSGLVLPPLFVLLINRCHILPEERRLQARFGHTYREYLGRTRRWV